MKIYIDPEKNDDNGSPIPVRVLENVRFFGLAAMVDDKFVFRHEGDLVAVACAVHGLEVCIEKTINKIELQQQIDKAIQGAQPEVT